LIQETQTHLFYILGLVLSVLLLNFIGFFYAIMQEY